MYKIDDIKNTLTILIKNIHPTVDNEFDLLGTTKISFDDVLNQIIFLLIKLEYDKNARLNHCANILKKNMAKVLMMIIGNYTHPHLNLLINIELKRSICSMIILILKFTN